MMARNFLILLGPLSLLAALSVSAQTTTDNALADELVFMSDEEPAMKRAFEQARASLDGFLAKAKNPPADVTAFAVKVGIREGSRTEYFWVTDFKEIQGKFTGRIGNEPQMVKTVKNGQEYGFTKMQIVDWLYLDKTHRKMVGNFTYCALLTKESREELEMAKKRFGLECER